MKQEELKKYESRLMGLIPIERILTVDVKRPDQSIIEEFKNMEGLTPTISDVLDSLGINGAIPASVLKPLQQGKVIVGPAVTLRYLPERKKTTQSFFDGARARMADRDSYAVAEPGDVIVVDNGGANISCMGGLSAQVACNCKLAGSVIDGGVRDVDGIRKLGYPVWARGVTPISGKYRIEAIEINGPVTIAGIQVSPGDLIIADDTGVVVIPQDYIEIVLEKAKEVAAKEEEVVNALKRGATIEELKKILPPAKW